MAAQRDMYRRRIKPLILVLPVMIMTACTTGTPIPEGTTTSMPLTSTAINNGPATQIAIDAKVTADAQATAKYEATAVQATQLAEQSAIQASATAEVQSLATSQAQPMFDRVAVLQSSGFLNTTVGNYYALPDFDASWAQLNYYDWMLTGTMPANFVVSADAEWESASEMANWWNSGCGFAFRISARGDHYLAYLGLDGWVYLYRNFNNTVTKLGEGYYDEVQIPNGDARILLIVENDLINFFVNDRQVLLHQDDSFSTGLLGYVIVSGTNRDFGTRCRMTGVELWELQAP
jgi:hypothetical protein